METRLSQTLARNIRNCGSVVVEDRWLIVSTELPFLGASIDGSVECEKCGDGILEIKSPYGSKRLAWRNKTPESYAESSKFCCNYIPFETGT